MRRRFLAIFASVLALAAAGVAAKKTVTEKPVSPAPPQMTDDQKAIHALNRLTFGARPGDLEQVKQMGLDAWIDRQLHPVTIPESSALLARLANLETLQMTPAQMLERYPSVQEVKAMMDGARPLPADPNTRARVQIAIKRYKMQQAAQGGDGAAIPPPPPDMTNGAAPPALTLATLLTDEQRNVLLNGSQDDKYLLLRALPDETFTSVIEALPPALRQRLANNGPEDLRRRTQELITPQQVVNRDLTEGKLLRSIYGERQLQEVLTDFWYNHFNVFLDKGADRYMVTSYERDVIRPNVLGKFKDLLLATAQSPAMLFYLDNWQSVAPAFTPPNAPRRQGLNENYGRELMELHTLGVDGGYTQKDVTEVARCFTGWTIQTPNQAAAFLFRPGQHDRGEKHVLGVTIPAGGGMEDGLKVIDILAHHPATARFISRSLAIRFVADNPPDSLVDKMAQTFLASDGDLAQVMRTMLNAPEFWDAANFRSKVKSPLEFVVSSIRAMNANAENPTVLAGLMNQLGEPLYRKVEPTGYSNKGMDWLNSAALLARMNFASSVAQGRTNGITVDPAQFNGDAAQIERSLLFTDPTPEARDAIQAGLDQQKQDPATARRQLPVGPLVAGLTLGSPDFQRR